MYTSSCRSFESAQPFIEQALLKPWAEPRTTRPRSLTRFVEESISLRGNGHRAAAADRRAADVHSGPGAPGGDGRNRCGGRQQPPQERPLRWWKTIIISLSLRLTVKRVHEEVFSCMVAFFLCEPCPPDGSWCGMVYSEYLTCTCSLWHIH